MMKSNEVLKLAILAGEILLKSGAETFRVEDTVHRILKAYGFSTTETFTTTTGIFATIENRDGEIISFVKRIKKRTIDIGKIASVNDVSRKIAQGSLTFEEAYGELIEIDKSLTYSHLYALLGWATCCAGFTFVLDASITDAFFAFLIGICTFEFNLFLTKKNVSRIGNTFSSSLFITLLSIIFIKLNLGENMDNIIIGGLMPLVPGIASINAIRDVLSEDYLSATARLLDVILVSICIALGVGFGLQIFIYLGGI